MGTLDQDKLHAIIAAYKANFSTIDEKEHYKWAGIGWFQVHWDIDAKDFSAMVSNAFSKMSTILASSMYFPYGMLTQYAQQDPEAVRELFRVLYNEELPLTQRYIAFRQGFEAYLAQLKLEAVNQGKNLQHFQDLRAVMVYLTCEFPEKYFFFKSKMFTAFRQRVNYVDDTPKQKSPVWKVESYTRMCQLVLESVKNDSELIDMSKKRLTNGDYKDEQYHLLTMDIIYFGGAYLTQAEFDALTSAPQADTTVDYWPAPAQYSPGITVSQWLAALKDTTITTKEPLDMLNKMLELGGESTCAHLAEVYGGVHNYYNMVANNWAGKVKKAFHCPDCIDRENDKFERNRVYVIPFVGRPVVEHGNQRYSWRLRDELKEALMELKQSGAFLPEQATTDIGLNTILYGPPGTGKTYQTVLYAVAIIEGKTLTDIKQEEYASVLERYNEYKAQGCIEFTTFHQSYGYEEFIEGIKPVPALEYGDTEKTRDISYSVQPGIFKKFCELAQRPVAAQVENFGINSSPNVWKVSLCGTGENPIRKECLANDHIRIGWDSYGKDITDETAYTNGGCVVLNTFMNRMQVGDIVFSCYSATTIDAVGVVTGEYEWHDEYPNFKRLRTVHWIVKDIQENILAINGGVSMTLASVYRLSNVALTDVYQLIEKHQPAPWITAQTPAKPYVFVIDEINRGNISKIFGELITLVEPSKRLGRPEELKAILPYSQKSFGVPGNVYLLGTMNTADRSIATLDTALRRRFQFTEVLPDPSTLADIHVEDLSISEMLLRMNQRIAVLYDREHTIGHAYFMPLKANPTIDCLAEIFSNCILPLLQEYFYEDYEKIRLVLGDNKKESAAEQFIIATENDYAELFGNTDMEFDDGFRYEINEAAFENIDAYRSI